MPAKRSKRSDDGDGGDDGDGDGDLLDRYWDEVMSGAMEAEHSFQVPWLAGQEEGGPSSSRFPDHWGPPSSFRSDNHFLYHILHNMGTPFGHPL